MRPKQIISGGQTGADQAGLIAARELGISTGGYAPKDFKTQDGPAPWLAEYGVKALNVDYATRTRFNIDRSDGTVIFSPKPDSSGTRLTIRVCKALKKPYILNPEDGNTLYMWCVLNNIEVLNVAGNRESRAPGISNTVIQVLTEAFKEV